MHEFDLIQKYFYPLSKQIDGSNAIGDDAAMFVPKNNMQQVFTKDVLVENVHFFADDAPELLAQKLLAVNVSDIAAMGAAPCGYLLGLALPRSTKELWVERFAKGFKKAMEHYGGVLLGGDTTSHDGPLILSLTAIGELPPLTTPLFRSGACGGQSIYVSGAIGDAGLGLAALQGRLEGDDVDAFIKRYHVPQARVPLGQKLLATATAAADVSDGLLADIGHICAASGVGAEIYLKDIPVSSAASALIEQGIIEKASLLSMGDDYELVFTVDKHKETEIAALSKEMGLPLTRIGVVNAAQGVVLRDPRGNELAYQKGGYTHF